MVVIICEACKRAGNILTDLRTTEEDMERKVLSNMLTKYHKICIGETWCDCQHKEGDYTCVIEQDAQLVNQ